MLRYNGLPLHCSTGLRNMHDKTGKIIIVSLLEVLTITACQKIIDERKGHGSIHIILSYLYTLKFCARKCHCYCL